MATLNPAEYLAKSEARAKQHEADALVLEPMSADPKWHFERGTPEQVAARNPAQADLFQRSALFEAYKHARHAAGGDAPNLGFSSVLQTAPAIVRQIARSIRANDREFILAVAQGANPHDRGLTGVYSTMELRLAAAAALGIPLPPINPQWQPRPVVQEAGPATPQPTLTTSTPSTAQAVTSTQSHGAVTPQVTPTPASAPVPYQNVPIPVPSAPYGISLSLPRPPEQAYPVALPTQETSSPASEPAADAAAPGWLDREMIPGVSNKWLVAGAGALVLGFFLKKD